MDQFGFRIVYDQDGEIITILNEIKGSGVTRKEITNINHIDLEYGEIDILKERIVKVDVSTRTVVTEPIVIELTDEQKRIKELEEDVLLLQIENEIGGIL